MLFPHQANGSVIEIDGKTYGSELLAQQFTQPEHLWGRPMSLDLTSFTDEDGNPVICVFRNRRRMGVEPPRKNPDQLLRAIRKEESGEGYGKLKIFFGYAAGVGKTCAMLEAAHQTKQRGVDVVAGYIELHARPQTTALLEGLEQLPVKEVPHGGITVREFDIDGALERKPQLILVDELAHTNAAGSRHTKRYQDVQELLKAGIHVYTTVNVQHLESLNDTVASITGVFVRERIPDDVFDQADQVELVDIEPKDLLERMASGNIYREEQAQRATANFFTVENLTALREIALRRCADRVNLLTESACIQSQGDYHTDEHILVCISSSPSNPKIIRTAARMASAFRSGFTALYGETPNASAMDEEDRKRLRENMHLAQQLGATIETCHGEDIAYQIAEYARLSGVSKIVVGRSAATKKGFFSKPTLTERLIANPPNLDIHIIPDASANGNYRAKKRREPASVSMQDVVKSLLVLIVATLVSMLESDFGEEEMCGNAFEFVAGKSLPAFFGALSWVAEGFENVQAMRPFIIPQRKHASSRATAVLAILADFLLLRVRRRYFLRSRSQPLSA